MLQVPNLSNFNQDFNSFQTFYVTETSGLKVFTESYNFLTSNIFEQIIESPLTAHYF